MDTPDATVMQKATEAYQNGDWKPIEDVIEETRKAAREGRGDKIGGME